MGKYTRTTSAPVLGTTGEVISTHEGGTGYVREPKAELYVTAVSSLMKPTFYESEDVREGRLASLSQRIGVEDPDWAIRFVTWLRQEANMRSVSIVVACNAVKGRLKAGLKGENRKLIAAAILRPDEPGEVVAYWQARFGRNLPMPVKRGIADAVTRGFSERAALRYDGNSGAMRLGDVVELVHPRPKDDRQAALFGYLLDRRHGRRETPKDDLDRLPAIVARNELNALPIAERHDFARQVLAMNPDAEAKWVRALAGQWEWGKSWLGQTTEDRTFERVSEADQWKLFVQNGMGYMALLRNLRNFDEAKIEDDVYKHVNAILTSEDEVKRSRQFPFRFYSAYKATQAGDGKRWESALNIGLTLSLDNVPSLTGRTLILADMSGSMFPYGYEPDKAKVWNYEIAALFASALGLRAEHADVVQFGTSSVKVTLDKGAGILANMGKFRALGGTQTMEAVRTHFRSGFHDRVIIITDEQMASSSSIDAIVPEEVPVYTWNVAGYRAAHMSAGPNRHTFGGLTDQSWSTIPLIETGSTMDWPF